MCCTWFVWVLHVLLCVCCLCDLNTCLGFLILFVVLVEFWLVLMRGSVLFYGLVLRCLAARS